MTELRSLEESESDSERLGAEYMVQLVRVLRVVTVHDLGNEVATKVCGEFAGFANELLNTFPELQLQVVSGNVYFNGSFVRLKGGAFESAVAARRLFKRLGVSEIAIHRPLDDRSADQFYRRFQDCMQSSTPEDFAKSTFKAVRVTGHGDVKSVAVDRRMELARTYAQLVVLMQEASELLLARKNIALAQIRRGLQQLVQVADGQESLLAGLTRVHNADGDHAMHAVAVASLSVLMGQKLGLDRRRLISLGLAALFHDIGRIEFSNGDVDLTDPSLAQGQALQTVLMISRFTGSSEALERTALAYEYGLGAAGDGSGIIPSTGARIVAVASCFDTATQPRPPTPAVRPDVAVRLMQDSGGGHFDKRVLKLFTSVVGIYPVGSLVRVSGGRTGVVVALPEDPTKVSRPTIKVIKERGAAADYLLELESEPPSVRVEEVLDAREHRTNVTHFLLA